MARKLCSARPVWHKTTLAQIINPETPKKRKKARDECDSKYQALLVLWLSASTYAHRPGACSDVAGHKSPRSRGCPRGAVCKIRAVPVSTVRDNADLPNLQSNVLDALA